MTDDDHHYLTRPEAAQYLMSRGIQITKTYLGQIASRGGGPIYRRFGRQSLYLRADLDNWITRRISQPLRSTSDLPAR